MRKYNLDSVKELAGEDDEFVQMLVETFLEEVPYDLEEMNEALYAKDPQATYQKAHKMKPNLLLFGLDLKLEIEVLESWAKQGTDEEKVDQAGATITQAVREAQVELKKDFNLQ